MTGSGPRIPVLYLAWQGARAGIERHLATLLAALPERFAPSVAFLSVGGPMADQLAARGVPVHVVGMRRSYDPRGAARVVALVRRCGARLVHDHSTMAPAPIAALALARVPVVVTEHLAMAQRRLDQRLCYRLLSGTVEQVIANSNATRADLVAHGVAAARVRVIPHGLSPAPPGSRAAARAAVRAAGVALDEDAPLIGFVGRLEPEKGCGQFIAMAQRVAAAIPAAQFAIIGDGSQRAALAGAVAAAGLQQRVHLVGAVAAVERWYPALDVLVSTSQRETFGLAILEAMAAGIAVAAFDVGGVRELLVEDAGVIVPAGAVAELADAVVRLVGDRDRRAAVGVRARDRVHRHYTADRMAAAVAAVYDDVLRRVEGRT